MRIIAGTARGRTFTAPEGLDTRPTLDHVKEAVFGMLQFDIPESRVLDLFSGSGSMGLEAASRGASAVVMNDRNPQCAALIRRNAADLGLDSLVRVMQNEYQAALSLLAEEGASFDLVFLDAPYHTPYAHEAASTLFLGGLLAEGALVVVEHDSKTPVPPVMGARVRKTKRYGKCAVTVLEREDAI